MAIGEIQTGATVRVCTFDELIRDRFRVVSAGGHVVLVLVEQGTVFALDNRCPHMGFPLHRGTVRDGILTCHWHHAKFDLAGGCTLDPFADDVPSFRVEVRAGDVWLDPRPITKERRAHWMQKLNEGLEQNIRLVLAKSVIGLDELGAQNDILRTAASFALRNRARGWSAGLSILTAMANVLPALDPEDRGLALYQGLVHVANSTQGQPPSFGLEPLETHETRPERYLEWFRRFIDNRSAESAERTLRTAIRLGFSPQAIAEMIFAACTDHLYLDEGHTLDFANKAFELLDHLGWEQAEEVLPSLIPALVQGTRMEETSAWRHPVNLPSLLGEIHGELDDLVAEGARHPIRDWEDHQDLGETLLDGEPRETLGTLRDLVRQGVPLVELSAAVAYAAARRPVHFHISNEFGDWDTVHHTFTYTNAVDQALRRSPSRLAARGIFDGAMSVYLERFLNVPKEPIPSTSDSTDGADILEAFDIQGQVDETARLVAGLLSQNRQQEVVRLLGHALLREDAGFHQFQIYEAALRQYERFAGTAAGDHVLIGAARFLTAHAPTVRAVGQTFDIAARLHRGESLHGEDSL